jgi:hypothetical protein
MINAGRVLIIPKGEWTNLESYEMLDLVTRGDIAYIARQASVGVDPATDTQLTYWQPFGTAAKIATTTTPGLVMPDGTTVTIDATGLISANIGISDINNVTITSISNGQILQYNSSTQKWENKSLGSAASRNATSSITSGSTDLIESGAVNSLKQTLTKDLMKEKKKDLNSRYFLFVGDSYGDESGEWASLVISYLGLTHATKLCVSGASFRDSNPQYNFLTQIQNYNGDKSLITDIVVCGGFNDSISDDPSAYTDTISGMVAFNTYVKANYPNANVSLGYIGNGSDRDTQGLIGARVYAARNVCREVYYNRAALLGWSILYNVEYTLCPYIGLLGNDGVHPSSAGNSALCISIAQAIKNGMCDVIYPESTLNPSGAIGSVSTGDIKYKMCNDKATISSRIFTILTNAGTVFSSGTKAKIATLRNILLNKEICFLGYTRLYNLEVDNVATSTYLWIPVMITIDEQSLYITPLTTDGATSHTYNYVSAGYLTLCDFDYEFDSMITV